MTGQDAIRLCDQALDHLRTQPLTADVHADALQLYYWLREDQPVAGEEAAINTAKRILQAAGVIA
jgi:hypothetical protein